MSALANVPPSLKVISPYIKTAIELYKTKPVVAYHCFIYSMRIGLKSNYKTDGSAKTYLYTLMDYVETLKSTLCQNPELEDSVKNDMEGQLLVESAACEYFDWADGQDRNGNFSRKVIKSFYISQLLFNVLTIFNEEVSDKNKSLQKYASWKAIYIKQCLAKGEKPIPGPLNDEDEDQPSTSTNNQQPTDSSFDMTNQPASQNQTPQNQTPQAAPRSNFVEQPFQPEERSKPAVTSEGISLNYSDYAEAQKLCKYAGSALSYEDTTTAINYLEKCLHLLKTGNR